MNKFRVKDIDNFAKLSWVRKYMNGHEGFIAGGCFKDIFSGKRVKDLDMFFEDSTQFNIARDYFVDDKEFEQVYENKKVLGLRDPSNGVVIELVKTVYGTPKEIISNFDFTITKFVLFKTNDAVEELGPFDELDDDLGLEGEVWITKVMYHPDYFEHLSQRRLIIDDELVRPVNTFERVLRYTKYGYGMCRDSKLRLLTAIIDWNDDRMNNLDENDSNSYGTSTLAEELSKSLYEGLD